MRGPPVGLANGPLRRLQRWTAWPARGRQRRVGLSARLVWRAHQGETPPTRAETLGLSAETVRRRMRRFNTEGLAALEDHHRSGRPATFSPEQVATVVALALTAAQSRGLPFASWTLDRRAAYLSEHKALAIRRSRIDEILLAEGLRWRRHETWFGERVDPEFAEQRGASRGSPPPRRRAA
jgi:transposase